VALAPICEQHESAQCERNSPDDDPPPGRGTTGIRTEGDRPSTRCVPKPSAIGCLLDGISDRKTPGVCLEWLVSAPDRHGEVVGEAQDDDTNRHQGNAEPPPHRHSLRAECLSKPPGIGTSFATAFGAESHSAYGRPGSGNSAPRRPWTCTTGGSRSRPFPWRRAGTKAAGLEGHPGATSANGTSPATILPTSSSQNATRPGSARSAPSFGRVVLPGGGWALRLALPNQPP
jgi:hypothetical protein